MSAALFPLLPSPAADFLGTGLVATAFLLISRLKIGDGYSAADIEADMATFAIGIFANGFFSTRTVLLGLLLSVLWCVPRQLWRWMARE